MTDIRFTNHGSVWLAEPLTLAANDWLVEHIAEDASWFGGALVVEPRYVEALVLGMTGDGLAVTGSDA